MNKKTWDEFKKEIPENTILFKKIGDFYEAFYDDAVIVSPLLNLTLHKRKDVSCIAIPYHAIDKQIGKLITVFKKQIAIIE